MGSNTIRVLIADDYNDGAEALAVLLRQAGCDVCVVNSGKQAVEVGKTFKPHAVILDLQIPDLDGLKIAAALRQQAWSVDAVFIAYTGVSTRDIVARVKEAGFQHFLRKPTPFEEFENILWSLPRRAA
jgi:two-component system OmpR family response regulator